MLTLELKDGEKLQAKASDLVSRKNVEYLVVIRRTGGIRVLAACLIAGEVGRSRRRIIGLDRFCIEHRTCPKATGRGRRNIYDVRPNIFLRKRVSFDFYRLFRAAGRTRLHGL